VRNQVHDEKNRTHVLQTGDDKVKILCDFLQKSCEQVNPLL
jgi:hypothetical protein